MSDRYIVDLAGTLKSRFKIANVWAVDENRQVATASGELTGGGNLSANRTLGLADSGVTPAMYGDAATVPQITVDAKGRVTLVTARSITAAGIGAALSTHTHAWGQITSAPTTLAGYGITDAVGTGDSRLTNSRAPSGSAGGDLTGSFPNPTLTTSGVAAGTYGSTSLVPIIVVDAKGRLTGVTTAALTAEPTGAAGGSLTGSFPNPTIAAGAVGLTELLHSSITVTAGTGLTGGGVTSLGGTATLTVAYGTSSSTACVGNDSRLSDSRAPTGAAGGSLGGTYPNPSIAASAITNTEVSASAAIAWSKISKSGAVPGDVGAAATSHTHAWSDITSTPTTLAGYGITNGVASTRTVSGGTSLTGGGALTGDLTLTLVNDSATPGNSYYYGTNSSGTKGWFTLPVATTGAPANAKYLVLLADATLTLERVFTPSGGIVGSDGGAGAAYTLSLTYGTTALTVCQGNDSRLTNSRAPNGSASGDLAGSYPAPTLIPDQVQLRLSQAVTPLAAVFTTVTATGITTSTLAAATISVTGAITSTLATGTAPFVVASTTAVANLNASLLLGNTWAIPGTIGSTTKNTGAFTTLTSTLQSGFSGVVSSSAAVNLGATNPSLSGTTQNGVQSDWRGNNAATANIRAAFFRAGTNGTGFTAAVVTSGVFGNVIVGAGDTITRGICITLTPVSGATNNYGLTHSTGTPATGTYFIYDDAGYASKVSGIWTYTDMTDSSSTATGSIIAAGGVGIAKSLTVGTGATITGAATALNAIASDSGTTNEPNVLVIDHTTSGTPSAGFGTCIAFKSKSTTTVSRDQASIITKWETATDASRTASVWFYAYDTAARECIRIAASGSAPMLGFLGATPTARVAITGSRGSNAALASLLTELASKGLITDSTS